MEEQYLLFSNTMYLYPESGDIKVRAHTPHSIIGSVKGNGFNGYTLVLNQETFESELKMQVVSSFGNTSLNHSDIKSDICFLFTPQGFMLNFYISVDTDEYLVYLQKKPDIPYIYEVGVDELVYLIADLSFEYLTLTVKDSLKFMSPFSPEKSRLN